MAKLNTVVGYMNPEDVEYDVPFEAIERLAFESENCLGSADSILTLDPGSKAVKAVTTLARRLGLKPRNPTLYSSACLLAVSGSVYSHTDPSLGILLSWVVHVSGLTEAESFDGETVELVCGARNFLTLRRGSLFLFNADTTHALLSNHTVVLIQLAVSK